MLRPFTPSVFVPFLAATCTATAQVAWTIVSPPSAPTACANARTAFDASRGVAVLFGGRTSSGATDQTWEYGPSGWIQRTGVGAPPARWGHGLVFDQTQSSCVLFGGRSGGTDRNDTWKFDGATWTPVNAPGPLARTQFAMAFDSVRQETILFGGWSGGTSFFADTWRFGGGTWTQLSPVNSPSARAWTSMAFDSVTNQMILFGGWNGATVLDDTWAWNGTDWTAVSTATSPPARHAQSMSFDAARARIVMIAGNGAASNVALADTWEFDGADWTMRSPTTTPAGRWSASIAYDPLARQTILFGGTTGQAQHFGDTWIYEPVNPATSGQFGSGCAGTSGVPILDATPGSLPWTGETFELELSSLPPSLLNVAFVVASLTNLPAPLDLGFLGLPGCGLLVSLDSIDTVANQGGSANWSFQVPTNPAFVGTSIFAQGFVLDPTANAFGAVASNGVEFKLGSK